MSPDLQILMWALGGVGAASFGGIGLLWSHLSTTPKTLRDEMVEALKSARDDATAVTDALWAEINANKALASEHRVEIVREFATKSDVRDLGDRIDRRLDENERRMMQAIAQRGPVQS